MRLSVMLLGNKFKKKMLINEHRKQNNIGRKLLKLCVACIRIGTVEESGINALFGYSFLCNIEQYVSLV